MSGAWMTLRPTGCIASITSSHLAYIPGKLSPQSTLRFSGYAPTHRSLVAALLTCKASGDQSDDNSIDASQSPSSAESASTEPRQSAIPASTLRKLAAVSDALEALDLLIEELGTDNLALTEADCISIMAAALERDNVGLAQSIFQAMTAAAAGNGTSSFDASSTTKGIPSLRWAAATPDTATALVIGLCRALKIREAVDVIRSVRSRGLPSTEDVQFGYVVDCPAGAEGKPLAVVQPQEGVKPVADSYTRYEYELFSGRVVNTSSESLITNANFLLAAAQRIGILRRPSSGAVHTAVIETPAGLQRTFRFGTLTPDVPAKQGDRITVVCAPQTLKYSQRRLFLSASPPGAKPGEPLSISNHTSKLSVQLLRPPSPGGGSDSLPAWVLPATVLFAASDAATSLVDPVLPYIVAGAAAAVAASTVAGTRVLLPRMKQLSERSVELQATRQKLLGQHVSLERRVSALVDECEEDVRTLARLWQLQNKMGAVAGGEATYDARLERVSSTRAAIEARLAKRMEAVDAYARVLSMIEIEVEMETEVPIGELQGIEVQIERLREIEELQEEWQLQAEAQDEVERLLRTAPP